MQIQFELKLNQFINDSISMFYISIIWHVEDSDIQSI